MSTASEDPFTAGASNPADQRSGLVMRAGKTSGFETGVNLKKLIAVRDVLRREMPDETLYGGMAKAGLPMVEMAGQK